MYIHGFLLPKKELMAGQANLNQNIMTSEVGTKTYSTMTKISTFNHPLDNPIWNALTSGNKHLGSGNESVKYFDRKIAPFAGMKELNQESLEKLYDLLPDESVVAIVIADILLIENPWIILNQEPIYQMVYERTTLFPERNINFIPLNSTHVPAMLELTALTKPGPFLERTIEFGNYYGIFNEEKLVAMAGFRMQTDGYIEISAVCTHPDSIGKGYGTTLLTFLANQIISKRSTPFLHVRVNNIRAIELYKNLGFTIRQTMNLSIIKKP